MKPLASTLVPANATLAPAPASAPMLRFISPTDVAPTPMYRIAPAGVPINGVSSATFTLSVPVEDNVPSDTTTPMPNASVPRLALSSSGPDNVTV